MSYTQNTAGISTNELEIKPLQSTKDLNIKEKEREFFKNKKERTGHHLKLNEQGEPILEEKHELLLNENPESESLLEIIEHKIGDTLGAAKDSIVHGYTAVKDVIIGHRSDSQEKA